MNTQHWWHDSARILAGCTVVAVFAACSGGDGSTTPIGPSNPGPTPPTGTTAVTAPSLLAITATTVSSLQLSWQDNAGDESGYQVERTPDPGDTWVVVHNVSANVTTLLDINLPGDASFRYRVRAVRGGDVSTWSNTAAGRTNAPPPPVGGPPVTPTAIAVSTTRIVVRWTDTSTTADSLVVQRQLVGTADTAWVRVAMRSRGAQTFIDSTLAPGQRVRFRLVSYRAGVRSTPSGAVDAVTHEEPAAVSDHIVDVVSQLLPGPGTPLQNRNYLAELRKVDSALALVPEIVARILFTGTLTLQVVTADGTSILISNNKPSETPVSARVGGVRASLTSASGRAAGRVAGHAANSPGAPTSKRAVVAVHDGGPGGNAYGNEVRNVLSSAGYSVLGLGTSLADMRQYKDLGVLYLDTHMASYKRVTSVTTDAAGTVTGFTTDAARTYVGLESSTKFTKADFQLYKTDLEAGDLVLSISMTNGVVSAKVAITERFIAKHWTFADGVAVIHACYFGSPPFMPGEECNGACLSNSPDVFDPGVMRAAMRAAGAANIVSFDYYVGYDGDVLFAAPSMRFYFDRLIGANVLEPLSPPRRAFPHSEVHAAMQQNGLTTFRLPEKVRLGIAFGGKDVNLTFDSEATSILKPSIRDAEVIDDASAAFGTVTVRGVFGNNATVHYNGQPLAVTSSSTDEIVAQLPYDEASRSGDLEVLSGGGIKSNKVPVTEWSGTVTVTTAYDNGALGTIATLNLRFRGDIHPFRQTLASTGFVSRVVETTVSPSSTGTVRGFGSKDGGAFVGTEDVRWYPRAIIQRGGDSPANVTEGGASLTLLGSQAELCISLWGYVTVTSGSASQRQIGLAVGLFGFDHTRQLMGCLTLPMSSSFVIGGGARVLFEEENARTTIQWSQFVPVSVPTGTTPG